MNVILAALSVGAIILVCGPAEAQTLDQQAKCAAQARIAFTEIETQRRLEQLKYGNKDINGTFASYLNMRLNRCFVMIDRTFTDFNKNYATETDLTDAISRHGYAFYSDRGGKMLTCDLSPRARHGSSAHRARSSTPSPCGTWSKRHHRDVSPPLATPKTQLGRFRQKPGNRN
jgi:hypothetical protein